jgi:hypothetical protein
MAATIFGCAIALEGKPEVPQAIRDLRYDVCCLAIAGSVISCYLATTNKPRSR